VPEVFIIVLGITYRYLFLLLQTTNSLFLARASRTVGKTTGGEQRLWVGATAGALVGRSLKMSNDVYQAMVPRGYNGQIRTITDFLVRVQDWLFLLLAVTSVMGLIIFDGSIL
jgi:cobalt/nickel transport system permease protein